MRSDEIKAAVINLKRGDQWRLRGDPSMPELLTPTRLISEQELEAIFSGSAESLVTKLVLHKKLRAAVLRYPTPSYSSDENRLLSQIYTGATLRSPHIVIGKIGCVDLIRKRIAEEGEFVCSVPSKVTINELAEYVSPKSPESEMKFLHRLNSGKTVTVLNVNVMRQALFIDMDDVAFAVPTVYSSSELAPVGCASLWAEPWTEWVEALDNRFGLEVAAYNIYFNPPTNKSELRRLEIGLALGTIYNALVADMRKPDATTKSHLRNAAEGFRKLGLDCWVSYRTGVRTGEPDHQHKLFITISEIGSIKNIVIVRGYVRYDKNIFFDRLPKSLPYMR